MSALLFPSVVSTADMLIAARDCSILDPVLYVLKFRPSYSTLCNQRILNAFGLDPQLLKLKSPEYFQVVISSSLHRPIPSYSLTPINSQLFRITQQKPAQSLSLITDQQRLALISALLQNCSHVPLFPHTKPETQPLQQPFPGTYGWDSFEALFSFLSNAVIWCLLRNHEYHINGTFWECDSDLDILSPNLELLVCASNAKPRYGGISSFFTTINGRHLNLDLRSIGDKYYDPAWAIDILRTRVKEGTCIYRPSDAHYLFMLIYHALLQKQYLSDQYYQRICSLSDHIYSNRSLHHLDKKSTSIYLLGLLDMFLMDNNYVYTFTSDCYVNIQNVSKLKALEQQYPGLLLKPLLGRLLFALVYRLRWKLKSIRLAFKVLRSSSAKPQHHHI